MKVDKVLLEEQIKERVFNYASKRNENRQKSREVTMLCASLSAITTVLIGLSAGFPGQTGKILGMFALGTSAFVSVIAALDSLFNHKKLWVLYTEHWIAMEELLCDLEHAKRADENNDALYAELYDRFKAVRRSLDTKWKAMKLEDFSSPSKGE